jgi:hypothetical protein
MNIFFDENVILELRIHLSNLLLGITGECQLKEIIF